MLPLSPSTGAAAAAAPVNLTTNDVYHYIEGAVIAAPRFDDGSISFVIADFAALFGTGLGEQLRAFACVRGFPLVWAYGSGGVEPQPHPWGYQPIGAMNRRMLDPSTICGGVGGGDDGGQESGQGLVKCTCRSTVGANLSAVAGKDSTHAQAVFEAQWRVANATWETAGWVPPAVADAKDAREWWGQLEAAVPGEGLAVRPMAARRCADADMCIGTTVATGDCVCAQGKV
jgi:hypothetical protein